MTSLFQNLEFLRSGFGLLPNPKDKHPGTAVYLPKIPGSSGTRPFRSCTCSGKKKTCGHIRKLADLVSGFQQTSGGRNGADVYEASLWHRLGEVLHAGEGLACTKARVAKVRRETVRVFSRPDGGLLLEWLDPSPAGTRFLERTGKVRKGGPYLDRAGLLQKLGLLLRTHSEHRFNKAGLRSNQQSMEESFWGRAAYHGFREYGESGFSFHPEVNERSGDFTLICRNGGGEPLFRLVVPRKQVRLTLRLLVKEFPEQEDLVIRPIPLRSIFKVSRSTELDLEVRGVIQALQASGESFFLEQEEINKYRYGDLVYVRELGVLAELERASRQRKFRAPVSMKLARSQVPNFLAEHQDELEAGAVVFEDTLSPLDVFKDYDSVEISPSTFERSWYWLSIRYGFGSESVSLVDLLKAKKEGIPYFETASGWVDLSAEAFRHLNVLAGREGVLPEAEEEEKLRLSPLELLRLTSSSRHPVRVQTGHEKSEILERLLALEPSRRLETPDVLASPLRPYQSLGFEWLRFLEENRLAGLLCDDMGLGKTHQAMALMVWLAEHQKDKAPLLVICPTTVISHWRNKIREHAPGLKAVVHHGLHRNLKEALGGADVLVTSYGVLRNDILELEKTRFALVVFDEIQNLKNKDTQSYQAALMLQSSMKLGLTGTPIENSVEELKNLFDLVLPGLLGTDQEFAEVYGRGETREGLVALRRVISPFVLRRIKKAVLDELPDKIEDIRTCQLSDDQVKLYRDAVSGRGTALTEQLRRGEEPIPYIHVFGLLLLLKQICDHPALVHRRPEEHEKYQSGKWELFQELLFESLDSGQKVVIFTQFLGMIAMMERLLTDLDVGFATLTGSTRNRGEVIRRFNEDPGCRVFLGSLKAGGTGIDLVAGSVVVHYDRWWNAAREDQATDRVYRIGQKKAVQVFKLVTEGTLEEKISAIIDRKRRLMENVLQTDDPRLGKIFSRQELIELLQPI